MKMTTIFTAVEALTLALSPLDTLVMIATMMKKRSMIVFRFTLEERQLVLQGFG